MPLRSTTPLEIAFVGTTNDSTGGSVVLLNVTNTSAYEIRAWNPPFQIKINEHWKIIYPDGGLGSLTNLPPHSAYTFSVAAIPAGAAWRTPVMWAYDKSFTVEYARRFLIDNVRLNLRRLSEGKAPGVNGGNHLEFRFIYSQEVTNH